MAKKYYWLKLQKDFFKRHDIRIIEDMPNGKDYILFYMKLLVESISHEGSLRFNETIPYNESMLATITNTNIDIVRSAIKLFSELHLMDLMEDGTLFMSEVQTMMGVETEWAEKKRIYREKKGQQKTLSDKSKELEKDKEIETEIKKDKKTKKQINIPNGISSLLSEKLDEFIKYRKVIKKPILTDRPINSLVNNIGSEFVNEEHLIQCIDHVMDNEWQKPKGEYVKYKKPIEDFVQEVF